jgi:hypothetical protein
VITKHISHIVVVDDFELIVYRRDNPEFGWYLLVKNWAYENVMFTVKQDCESLIIRELNKYIFLIDQKIME